MNENQLGVKSNYIIMTEYPECTQDVVEYVCVCVLRKAASLALSLIEKSTEGREQHSWSINSPQRQRSVNSLNEAPPSTVHIPLHGHTFTSKILSHCIKPKQNQYTKDGE